MKKLLVVVLVLVLAGCSSNEPEVDNNVDVKLGSDGGIEISMQLEATEFELVEDTIEENEDGSYSGKQVFEGEDTFTGKLFYPSAVEGAWYFEPDAESLKSVPKYDFYDEVGYYALTIPGNEMLNAYLPEDALVSDCKYAYDAEVKVDGVAFNFTGFHIYNEIGSFELEDISNDYEEICD
jgi:hypothetical protein